MKTIRELKKEKLARMAKCFQLHGVFFAQDKQEYIRNKTPLMEGEKYIHIGNTCYCPSSKIDILFADMAAITSWYNEEEETILINQKNYEYENQAV